MFVWVDSSSMRSKICSASEFKWSGNSHSTCGPKTWIYLLNEMAWWCAKSTWLGVRFFYDSVMSGRISHLSGSIIYSYLHCLSPIVVIHKFGKYSWQKHIKMLLKYNASSMWDIVLMLLTNRWARFSHQHHRPKGPHLFGSLGLNQGFVF